MEVTDPDDEFEPLFDYSRIQPSDLVCVDDDDDDTIEVAACQKKKRKVLEVEEVKQAKGVNAKATSKEINLIDDDIDDWLPPPPKIIKACKRTLEVDATLKALRMKREELASFARSVEDVVRDVEESVKKDFDASQQSSQEGDAAMNKPSEPPADRPKLVISIQDKDGVKQFRVFSDDKFERLFGIYADRIKVDAKNLVFLFDGDKVSPTATPSSLDMEENDMIEVHIKSR